MGFQNSAPRFDDINLFIEVLNIWTTRADAAIISTEVPWKELLAGEKPEDYVVNNYKLLAEYYQSKDLMLWVYIDPQNGLDRASDALALVEVGKSIADPDMQEIYKRFVIVMDSILKPAHLGLALETNLIRAAATPAIYNGVKKAANDVASSLTSLKSSARLSISIQVDHAWGKLVGGSFEGVDKDFEDFPFMREIGLSSYPYFGFQKPQDIPIDYYSRLVASKGLPAFVSEGGWTSKSLVTPGQTLESSDQLQKEYIQKQHILLESVKASALFQLTFTDIDVDNLPPDVPDNLFYFTYLGLVNSNLESKPALDAWDKLFEMPRE